MKKTKPFRHRLPHSPGLWLYGTHTVRAALANPRRTIRRIVLTERAAADIERPLLSRAPAEMVNADAIGRLLPPGAVHQGLAIQCEPLPRGDLGQLLAESERRRIAVVLDQISDPHNVGAILRSAAAFGVAAVIVQDRHAPEESGALAKAASGALDKVPYIATVNIARALEELALAGFWSIALADDAEQQLSEANVAGDMVLVLGSEGAGVRRLVRERCNVTAFIPTKPGMESLNVSNAAAIALYEVTRG